MRLVLLLFGALALSACAVGPIPPGPIPPGPVVGAPPAGLPSPQQAADNFIAVVERVEPVAERICLQQAPLLNCDYQIMVDGRTSEPPNAFQTVDALGRPIIVFTIALIADARNRDELAFILGHEAAHHIAGHIPRLQETARTGALIGAVLTTISGGSKEAVQRAAEIGATLTARTYSKQFELEADALGTVIAYRAGFDPERGAAFFTRIADPGYDFLSTHPPNAQRIQTVRATLARLR